MAETADYDPSRFNSGVDFCGDELIDRGHGSQHATFVFLGIEVETPDVKPTSANSVAQVLSGKLRAPLRNRLDVPCWHFHSEVCGDTLGRTGLAWPGGAGSGHVQEDTSKPTAYA